MTPLLALAIWCACALLARGLAELNGRRYTPQHTAPSKVSRLAQTVAEAGWNRWQSGTMWTKPLEDLA